MIQPRLARDPGDRDCRGRLQVPELRLLIVSGHRNRVERV